MFLLVHTFLILCQKRTAFRILYLMIEEILFILECFGATNIFKKKMGKCCGNDISIFR